jgi:hypothetical protein
MGASNVKNNTYPLESTSSLQSQAVGYLYYQETTLTSKKIVKKYKPT